MAKGQRRRAAAAAAQHLSRAASAEPSITIKQVGPRNADQSGQRDLGEKGRRLRGLWGTSPALCSPGPYSKPWRRLGATGGWLALAKGKGWRPWWCRRTGSQRGAGRRLPPQVGSWQHTPTAILECWCTQAGSRSHKCVLTDRCSPCCRRCRARGDQRGATLPAGVAAPTGAVPAQRAWRAAGAGTGQDCRPQGPQVRGAQGAQPRHRSQVQVRGPSPRLAQSQAGLSVLALQTSRREKVAMRVPCSPESVSQSGSSSTPSSRCTRPGPRPAAPLQGTPAAVPGEPGGARGEAGGRERQPQGPGARAGEGVHFAMLCSSCLLAHHCTAKACACVLQALPALR